MREKLAFMSVRNEEGYLDWHSYFTFEFWRNMAVHFCLCSIVGHWLEFVWCSFCNNVFGIAPPSGESFADPFYPFCVYGIGACLCALALTPIVEMLCRRRKSVIVALIQFYVICVITCMLAELIMGLLMNQPNAEGVYPLWDNSQLPLNILKQAWLPNDIILGLVAVTYTCAVYPAVEILFGMRKRKRSNFAAAVIFIGFVVLCIFKF